MRNLLLIFVALCAARASQPSQFVNRSYGYAVKALQLAEKGDPVAQYEFALICEKGEGIPQNHADAVKWFRQASLQDYAPAQLFLGLMYASGKGVPKNQSEALKWLHLAAQQDEATAQFYLGGLYFSSSLVQQDYVQAYLWFTLAGRNDPSRTETLGTLTRLMSPAQVLDAQLLVKNWTPRKHR